MRVSGCVLHRAPRRAGAAWWQRPACCIGEFNNVEGRGRRARESNGSRGYPYGFNVTTEDGKPVVSFAYASRALAEAAATHLESALLNAISVRPYAD